MNRDTICVQGGYTPGNGEPRQIPIIQSTTFKYATSEDMGKLFDLEADGYFYSRLQNPTCDMVAKKICELEGGTAAMLTSSGQAANFFALFNICEAGDHIVASSTIYGGTFNLISVTMKKMGITATFVDPLCSEEELDAAFRPNTKVVFGETIANPALTVLDIEKFAKAAHAHGVPLIVDNTFPTPVNCRPFEWGADIVTTPPPSTWTAMALCWAVLSWTAASSTGWPTPRSSPACVLPMRAIMASPTRSASAKRGLSSPRPPHSSCATSARCSPP